MSRQEPKKRKLLLHFDQHNTLQIACNSPKRTVQQGLNNFLTSVTWGEELENGEWIWRSSEPQLNKPDLYPNSITYFKHIERKYVVNTKDRELLYAITNAFTENDGLCFKTFYDSWLEKLRKYTKLDTDNPNTVTEDGEVYYLIVPLFFDLIQKLKANNYEFAIILRSFGRDSYAFLNTVNNVFNGDDEYYAEYKGLNINVNLNVGYLKRDAVDPSKIKLEFDGEVYEDEISVYKKINSIEGICAIRDHFEPWHLQNYNCHYAKPIWLMQNDEHHHHILVDDNIRFDAPNDCIANLRVFDEETNQFTNVQFEEYIKYSESLLIQPDLLKFFRNNNSMKRSENMFYTKIVAAHELFCKMLSKS